MSEVLIHAENVSKKFCRSLKRSLWYGMKDMVREALPFSSAGSDAAQGGSPDPTLRRDEFWAVHDVSFQLRRGECLGLIGHNGAGKTTLLKILNGLIKPDHGSITMRGRVGALIALGAGFNPILSGRENIYINASVLGFSKVEIDAKIDEMIDFADIREFIDTPVQSYSSGMSVRLGFAVASALQPDIMLLDEVLAVGDMAFQAKCFNRLGEMRKRGTAFILVSHNMHQITRFSDRGLHLSHGRVAALGPTASVVESFVSKMAESSAANSKVADDSRGTGSLGVEIVDAHFANLAGERVTEIGCDEPVTLVLQYTRHLPQVDRPILDVVIRLPDGEPFFQATSKACAVDLGSLDQKGRIAVYFPSIPANNQSLSVAFALWDSKFHELFHWRRGYALRVRGNPSTTGFTAIQCRWFHGPSLPNFRSAPPLHGGA